MEGVDAERLELKEPAPRDVVDRMSESEPTAPGELEAALTAVDGGASVDEEPDAIAPCGRLEGTAVPRGIETSLCHSLAGRPACGITS